MGDGIDSQTEALAARGRRDAAILWLLRNPHDWIHRRIETCAFVDDRWSRRRVSLDFTVPTKLSGAYLDCVPLALLGKRPLRGFDLRAADGSALSALTTQENIAVALRALTTLAELVLGVQLREEVVENLQAIVAPQKRATLGALNLMYRATVGPGGDAAEDQRRELMRSREFESLANELAQNFILLTPRSGAIGERQIIKYSFEDPLRRSRRPGHWPAERLGLIGARLALDLPAAKSAGSFHCEIEAPPDLEITRARINRDAVYRADLKGLSFSQRRISRRRALVFNRSLEARDGGGITRAHLRLPRTDLPIGARPRAIVWLRSRRTGFLRPAFATCLLTTLLLAAGSRRLGVLQQEAEPASTLMLLIPGLLAAYLSRPGEHVLASSLLLGVRIVLLVSGVCAVAAAALLIARLKPAIFDDSWLFLRDLSALASVMVLLANILPIRHTGWTDFGGVDVPLYNDPR